MPMGLLDLSIITDHLIQMLRDAIAVPPNQIWSLEPTPEGVPLSPPLEDPGMAFDITVTGNAPDARGNSTGCLLSMYLFHVAPSPYQRNTPVTGDRTRATPIPFQPLALELYYLLSAYSENRYIEEQQAMSIALKCFHEKPLVRNVTLARDGRPKGEFCLTMETESSDEIARLWQATTAAMRLSVVYKVSVVFIQPQEDERRAMPKVQRVALAVAPTNLPYADSGQVTAAFRHVRYFGPDDVRAAADLRGPDAVPSDEPGRSLSDYDALPAVAAPGESFLLYGAGFQPVPPLPIKLFLLQPNLPDQDVSAWIDATVIDNSDAKLHLTLPAPAGFPPGLYQLSVGLGANRTNATPFSIAARVDAAAPSPVLTYAGAALTLNGAGFLAGKTQVVIGGTPLIENAAVGAGQFTVLGDAQIQFQPPAGLPTGRYGIRVRVNHVESAPAMWVRIP